MSALFPSFDDVIEYRRRRLLAALESLGSKGKEEARAEAAKLLLEYVGDNLISAAFEQAVRGRDE